MVNCCVVGCKSRTERKCDNVTFHTFPKDKTSRKVWIVATGRQNWQPTRYTRLCSVHFKADCLQKKQMKVYLKKYSIPTLSIHRSTDSRAEDTESDSSNLTTSNMTITHLPHERLRSRRLCGDHFDPKCIHQAPGHRVYMLKNSIPKPYQDTEPEVVTQPHSPPSGPSDMKVRTPEKAYSNKSKLLNINKREGIDNERRKSIPKKRKIRDTKVEASDTPKYQRLQKKLNTLKLENDNLKQKINDMQQIKKRKRLDDLSSYNFTSVHGADVDSSGEYSDFDDKQAEARGDDLIQEYQIKVEQNEVNYDVCKVETVEHTLFSSNEEDRGSFVPASTHNMPEVNMFAVVEYICKHERGLKRLDYPKWKLLTKNNPNLITSIKVARTGDTCRLRGTVNFDRVTSHMCEVEYNVHTDTITSSECVCGNNPCEHVAAFLMWLAHKPTTDNTESEQVHSSSERGGPLLNELQESDSLVEDVKASVSDDVRPSTSRSDSNMEAVLQPPAKRQRMASEAEVPAMSESSIIIVPLPKDENEPKKSKIECTLPRKIIYNLWKSTTGSASDRSEKIQTTLKQPLQDDDYIIDFTPIEQRIEQLCVVFDIMKNEINKAMYTEFMNTKEVIELERESRNRNSWFRDPLS